MQTTFSRVTPVFGALSRWRRLLTLLVWGSIGAVGSSSSRDVDTAVTSVGDRQGHTLEEELEEEGLTHRGWEGN